MTSPPDQGDVIDRLRVMLRENPKLAAAEVRQAFELSSDSAAKTLITRAREAEQAAAAALVQTEQSTADRAFFLMEPSGQLTPLTYVGDNGKRVTFKRTNPT